MSTHIEEKDNPYKAMLSLTQELAESSKISQLELLFHGTINKIFSYGEAENARESALYETHFIQLIPQIIGGLALVAVSLCTSRFSQITEDKFTKLKERVDRCQFNIRARVGELSFDGDKVSYGARHFAVMNDLIDENLKENTQGAGWRSIGLTSVILSIVGLFTGLIWIGAASAAVACVAGAILFNHKHAIVMSKQSLITQLDKSDSAFKAIFNDDGSFKEVNERRSYFFDY